LAWIPLFHSLAPGFRNRLLRYQSGKTAQNMTTQSLDSPRQSLLAPVTGERGSRRQKDDGGTFERRNWSGVCCVSAQAKRSFAGRTDYESVEELDTALKEVARALPTVSSAYKPRVRTTATAAILMIFAAPVVLLVLLTLCGGLSWGWMKFESLFSAETRRAIHEFLDCFRCVDLLLMVLMVVIPMVCYGRLSRWFKNRNPVLPAVLPRSLSL